MAKSVAGIAGAVANAVNTSVTSTANKKKKSGSTSATQTTTTPAPQTTTTPAAQTQPTAQPGTTQFADEYAASRGSTSSTGVQQNGYTGVSSTHDKENLSASDVAKIEKLSAQYLAAKAAGDNAAAEEAHRQAEAIRAGAANGGYSGGGDGSKYIAGRQQTQPTAPQTTAPQMPTVDPDAGQGLKDYLDAWLDEAKKQSSLRIDYATQQGITELQRAEEDAQEQFQTQRDQVSRDERVALDNSALYSEARGDRGGIGEAQYDLIMANAAKNRLAVNQAQTKLSTDTARQIADLRAQGEFQKADQLLQLTQTYLSQLMQLEQWGLEYALSATQFNAQMQQWTAEFELSVGELMGEYKGSPTLSAQKADESKLASAGEVLLSIGVMPSASQLAAMGMTSQQAQDYLTASQLAAAAKGSGGGGGGGRDSGGTMTFDDVRSWAKQYASGGTDADADAIEAYVKEHHNELGYSSEGEALTAWITNMQEYNVKTQNGKYESQALSEEELRHKQVAAAILQKYDLRGLNADGVYDFLEKNLGYSRENEPKVINQVLLMLGFS